MKIPGTGTILNTEKSEERVAFYKDLSGLTTHLEGTREGLELTCFEYDGSYLVVERGGSAMPEG